MKDSSQQDYYSITLDDKTAADVITINVDPSDTLDYFDTMASGSVFTIDDTITLTGSSDYNIQYEIDFGDEWRTHFPDFKQVEKMCKEYPALEKAFEKFKTTYEMVKDDYANKTRDEG